MTDAALAAFTSLTSALLLVPLFGWLARRYGFVDAPSGHKSHREPIPAVGGLAWFPAWFAGLAVLGLVGSLWLLVLGLGCLALLGAQDDRFDLSPRLRLAVESLVVLALLLGTGVRLDDFGGLLPGIDHISLGALALPVSVFCMVGVINAFNMIDGLDGLSAVVILAALCGFAALIPSSDPLSQLLWPAVAATLGFLAFNLAPVPPRWKVFLGDAGTLPIGLFLAWLTVAGSQGESAAFAPVTALWLLALPLIDAVSVMWRRAADGFSPFHPDQRHVHHLLRRMGCSVMTSWWILLLVMAFLVLIGLAGEWTRQPESLRFVVFLGIAFSWHLAARVLDRRLPALP